jgi:hypothetical protein
MPAAVATPAVRCTACPPARRGDTEARIVRSQASDCPRGEKCCFAHNVFEYWLHPTRLAWPPARFALAR